MSLSNEERGGSLHDYLLKIGSYEMLFIQQNKMIEALKGFNHSLAKELQMRIDINEELHEELEKYEALTNVYHAKFIN